jgi:hypothetical protein
MEIYLSLGVSTIVAMMAANRTAARQDGRDNFSLDDDCARERVLNEASQTECRLSDVRAGVQSRNVTAKQKDRGGLQE